MASHSKILFLWLLLTATIINTSEAQDHHEAYGRISNLLYKTLDKYHVEPITINDKAAEGIFQHFAHSLDPYAIYFTAEELQELSGKQDQIDNDILDGRASFLGFAIQQYRQALQRMITASGRLAETPLNKETNYFLAPKNLLQDSLFATQNRWELRLEQFVRYQALKRVFAKVETSDENHEEQMEKLTEELGQEYKQAICEQLKLQSEQRLENLDSEANFVSNHYFEAITQQYDPHSAYFSIAEKELFETSLSDASYTFGFQFADSREGGLVITKLLPGGPAWKSNELNEDDVLLSLQIEGEEAIDLTLTPALKLREMLESVEGQTITIEVRKPSNLVKKVSLVKEKVSNDRNAITSFILENDGKKVGYISLPSFYTSSENEEASGCANDLATQLIALNRQGIDGLIFDLRNNGGGSVQEAINMIGMFIDVGPVFISKNSEGELYAFKDRNRGRIFTGPMTVLTNRFSASASEFFAAAMQDYNRALIVGGKTYGKATGQILLPISEDPLEELINAWMTGDNLGFVKVTTSKLYRITGKTHQKAGVIPDISLGQMSDAFIIGEEYSPTALKQDSVVKKVYARPLSPLPINDLKSKSEARQKAQPSYQKIKQKLAELFEGREGEKPSTVAVIPLQTLEFYRYWKARQDMRALLDLSQEQESQSFDVQLSSLDQEVVEATPSVKPLYEANIKRLKKDLDLEETFHIISNLISIQNN